MTPIVNNIKQLDWTPAIPIYEDPLHIFIYMYNYILMQKQVIM